MPTVDGNKVTFSAKTRLYAALYGTADASLVHLGLLGQNATLSFNQQMRTKKDGFPEVEVAAAIQSQDGTMQCVLREWGKEQIALAFGLDKATDITEVAGADTAVVDESVTLAAGVGVLAHKPKSAVAPVVKSNDGVTTYVANTDYLVITDTEGRGLVVRNPAGAIGATDTLHVSYTWTGTDYEEYPIGSVAAIRYFTFRLEEDFTNGAVVKTYIHKARVGLNGNLNINAVDNGADLPITIGAVYDSTVGKLATVRNYPNG